jgi:uncharacterized protein (DUF1330 family)
MQRQVGAVSAALMLVGCVTTDVPGNRGVGVAPAEAKPPAVTAIDFGPECNKPVMLVVWIDHLDRAKSGPYGVALRSSKIVQRHGGEYKAVSPPLRVLEGEWPADRGFVVERYPCLKAFEAFWYSDEYQQRIKPLREDSGQYTIALFEERER